MYRPYARGRADAPIPVSPQWDLLAYWPSSYDLDGDGGFSCSQTKGFYNGKSRFATELRLQQRVDRSLRILHICNRASQASRAAPLSPPIPPRPADTSRSGSGGYPRLFPPREAPSPCRLSSALPSSVVWHLAMSQLQGTQRTPLARLWPAAEAPIVSMWTRRMRKRSPTDGSLARRRAQDSAALNYKQGINYSTRQDILDLHFGSPFADSISSIL